MPCNALATDPSSRLRRSAVALLLLTLLVQLVHVARVTSANWDECHHLYDGYNIWTHHDYRLNAEVPPLVKLAAAAPLLAMHIGPLPPQDKSQALNAFQGGRVFVFGNGGDRVLFPARMGCAVFSLLLAALVYAAGRRLFGTWAGLAALALFVFDPLVLAHGTLVSTDVASALFLFGSVIAFYAYVQRPTWLRFGLAGVVVGLALVAKFTGILAVPMLLLLCVAEGLRLRSGRVLGRRLAACAGMFAIGFVVLWSFYGFRYAAAPNGLQLSPATAPYLAGMPSPRQGGELAWVARHHLLPEAYIWGLANTKYTEAEYTSYFFGRVYRHGPWQYFPVAFLVKSTLPLLLLLVVSAWLWRRSSTTRAQKAAFLLVPVAVYFAVVVLSHFDIGARHLMPVYPFLYVVAGAAVALLLRTGPSGVAAAAVLLGWQAVTSLHVSPAYMAYGNEAWGGPLHVRRVLSDANVDWGQQLKGVKQYLDANHITNCWFAYFPDGAVLPSDYGIACKRLPTPSGLWWMDLPMDVPPVIDGTVLLSESVLDGVESGDGPLNPYAAFQTRKPVAIVQDGVYVYQGRFEVPLASALVDLRRSEQLTAPGEAHEALALAQRAVALAPNQAQTQLQLADLLAAREDWYRAEEHYNAATRWLLANRPELESEDFLPRIVKGFHTTDPHTHEVK